jgi:hypothetical protein
MMFADLANHSIFSSEWFHDLGRKFSWELFTPLGRITVTAILTLGLYSLLYRENKFYRLVEHIFVGLAAGYSVVAIWQEVLFPQWWEPMTGKPPTPVQGMMPGHWAWGVVLPLCIVAFLAFSKNHSWMARIPLGIIVGLWAGQQFGAFMNTYLPQLTSTAQGIIPNKMGLSSISDPPGTISISSAINKLILVVGFLLVLSYFLYSFEQKNKIVRRAAQGGRWILMIGFGVIFGTTMMTRFVFFIERMHFLLVDWLRFQPPS